MTSETSETRFLFGCTSPMLSNANPLRMLDAVTFHDGADLGPLYRFLSLKQCKGSSTTRFGGCRSLTLKPRTAIWDTNDHQQ